MTTTKKIGRHTEYRQDIKYICGDVVPTYTLNYRIDPHELRRLQGLKCPHCRHQDMLEVEH